MKRDSINVEIFLLRNKKLQCRLDYFIGRLHRVECIAQTR